MGPRVCMVVNTVQDILSVEHAIPTNIINVKVRENVWMYVILSRKNCWTDLVCLVITWINTYARYFLSTHHAGGS